MSLSELLELPEIVEVVPSGEFEFSREYALDKFDFTRQEIVLTAFESMANYLDAPYIIDIFKSHEDRRKLRDRLSSRHLEAYENNALKSGRANAVCLSAEILARTYLNSEDKSFFDLLNNVKSFRESFSSSAYDLLRPDEKVTLAFSLKERIHEVFRYLEESG